MSTSLPASDQAILEAFQALKRLGKRELLELLLNETGTTISVDAYRHEVVGALMRHRYGDQAAAVVRHYR